MSQPPPYSETTYIGPPYNATNFTSANPIILSTLQSYASNSPNYPWATGTDAQQIYTSKHHRLRQQIVQMVSSHIPFLKRIESV